MSTLSLHSLSKRFNDTQTVHDVTLSISSGEFFSILGPSGCGKTTLLRMIAGFETPTGGSVHLNGKYITGVPPQHRGIGMVFQNYALFPHMTVFQNVSFGLETKNVPKADIRRRVQTILEAVHLQHKMHTPVPQLSGGEQQRVAVARALVVEPAVLLFDEPLSNLDVALRLSTREEIRSLQRRTGITTVYVTHDQSEAMSLSDRVAVMQSGRVVQIGPPAQVYEHPGSRFVAEFLGGANVVDGTYDASSRRFSSGRFEVLVPPGVAASSGNASLAIKPEALSFTENGLEATIVEREYLGFTTSFILNVRGVSLRMTTLSSDGVRQLLPGMNQSVSLDWSRVNLFTAQS